MAVSEKQKQTLLQGLTDGLSLRKACEQADIQAPSNVLFWCEQDPAFAEQYARARDIGWRMLADDLHEVADDTSIPADHRRIMVDTRKWMLSKMLPKIYGDKLDITAKVNTNAQLTEAELMEIAARGKTPGGDVQKG